MSFPFLRYIPTSTLDRVETCEPFVHATQWNSLRQSVAARKSNATGHRNSVQAIQSLNDPSDRVFVDTPATFERNPFLIAMKDVPEGLSEPSVDACFGDSGLSFLNDLPISSEADREIDYSLELELLETVNEIAASLARTRARRASPAQTVENS